MDSLWSRNLVGPAPERIAATAPVDSLTSMVAIRRVEVDVARMVRDGLRPNDVEWMTLKARLREVEATSHFGLRFPSRRLCAHVETMRRTSSQTRLVIEAEGRWFVRDGAVPVELRTRKRLARVLACLAQAQRGQWLDLSELYDAGWPDERCLPGSDTSRVHVTMSRRRSVGLDEIIESDDGRFRLSPEVNVALAPDSRVLDGSVLDRGAMP